MRKKPLTAFSFRRLFIQCSIPVVLTLSCGTVLAQNVGIGAASFAPNPSAMLEVRSNNNKGFLPPRVTFAERTAMNPLPAAAQGLIVYQTNISGSSLEGLYYNTSITTTPSWLYITGSGWSLKGNAGTIAGTDFIGTTDAVDWVIKTNNTERARVLATGEVRLSSLAGAVNVGSGNGLVVADASGQLGKYVSILPPSGSLELWYRPTAATPYIQPVSNPNIRVYDATGQPYGIYYDGGTNLIGGYFRTTSSISGSAAVQGFSDVSGNQTFGHLGWSGSFSFGANTISGAAVYGVVDDPNRVSVFGRTTANATYAACIGYSNVWIAGYYFSDDVSTAFGARPALYGQMNISVNKGGNQDALRGYSQKTVAGNAGWTVGVEGNAIGSSQDGYGIYGYYSGTGSTARSGGYFYSTDGIFANYAYVGDVLFNRKIGGVGAMSEVIPTQNHGRITLTAPESPEYWYIDYGTVQMVNGTAHVNLDPILKDIVVIDNDNPLKVITQVNIPNSNGVAVINKTNAGFDIVELRGGTSSGEVDYQIVAKPKTNFGEGRFPQAPGPGFLKKDKEPAQAKAANNPDRSRVFHWPADWAVYGYNPEDMVAVGDVIPGGPNAGKIKTADGKYAAGLAPTKK